MFNGEFFAVRGGTGRYVASNQIIHPVTKAVLGYGPGLPRRPQPTRISRHTGQEHEHRRERCRRYRQQHGRDDIWRETCA